MSLITTREGVQMSVNEPPSLWDALEPNFLAAFLKDRFQRHFPRRDQLLAGATRFKQLTDKNGIEDEATAAKATDFARQLRDEVTEIEKTHFAVKEPVKLAANQIDGMRRELCDPLVAARTEVNNRIASYLEAKDRAAREAAQREAQEAAERAQAALDQATTANDPDTIQHALEAASEAAEEAAVAEAVVEAKPADLSRIRTQLGSTSSLRYEWVLDGVDDITKVPAQFLTINEPMVKAALRTGTTSIPGLRIVQRAKATVR